ncbi:MAG: hypothetical protein ACXV2B_04290 [Halobacteriota archaeon]
MEVNFCSSGRPELPYAVFRTIEPWNPLNFLGQVVNFLFIQEYAGQHRPCFLVGSGSDVLELYPYDGTVQFQITGTSVDDDPYGLAACLFGEILAGIEIGFIGSIDETRDATLREIQRIGEVLGPHMKETRELLFFTSEGLTSVMRAGNLT